MVLSFKDWMNLRILACTLFFVFVLLCFLLFFFFFLKTNRKRMLFTKDVMGTSPHPSPRHCKFLFVADGEITK